MRGDSEFEYSEVSSKLSLLKQEMYVSRMTNALLRWKPKSFSCSHFPV